MSTNGVTYPLDMGGINPSNLVGPELHSVNEAHFRDYYFLVPDFAPFYIDNFYAEVTIGNVTRPLVEDVDFTFAIPYVTGTRTTGKAMYGAITLHNLNLSDIVSIKYQTIGGDQVADKLHVLTVLADKAYNPRTTIFELLTNVPNALPATPHYQDYQNFYGQEQVVTALVAIRDAIIQNSSLTKEEIAKFLAIINAGALSTFLKKTGDTMTGSLYLKGSPLLPLEAATKQYVDDNTVDANELNMFMSNYHSAVTVDAKLAEKVNKAGDTMTGHLTLNADPSQAMHPATKQYVDNVNTNIQSQITQINTTLDGLTEGRTTQEYVDARIAELMNYIHTISGIGR